jgi:hypothetical protein
LNVEGWMFEEEKLEVFSEEYNVVFIAKFLIRFYIFYKEKIIQNIHLYDILPVFDRN